MAAGLSPFVAVLLPPDPSFAARLTHQVTQIGLRVESAETADVFWRMLDRWPVLAFVDLAAVDWEAAVRWARNQPHTRAIPLVAFQRTDDPQAACQARAAGCASVWSGEALLAALPDLLHEALRPPTRWPEGWDVAPPPALCHAVAQFNAGEYWECHETLEALWVAERRPIRDLYQGILQVGVAFHHLKRRNYAGAIKLLRRGLPRLRDLPAVCQGVHVAALAAAAHAVHDAAVALGPERIGEIDLTALPQIIVAGCS